MSVDTDIYYAVRSAIADGLTAKEFIQKAGEQWEVVQDENARSDRSTFHDCLHSPPK